MARLAPCPRLGVIWEESISASSRYAERLGEFYLVYAIANADHSTGVPGTDYAFLQWSHGKRFPVRPDVAEVHRIAKPDISQSLTHIDSVLFGERRVIGVCVFPVKLLNNEPVYLSSQALVCHDCEAIVKAGHLLSNVESGHGR